MENQHKQSVNTIGKQRDVRCIDCIVDYFDKMLSGFCDEMDNVQTTGNNWANFVWNFMIKTK